MNAEDYKILINKVWFRGFWVPGIANQRSDKRATINQINYLLDI